MAVPTPVVTRQPGLVAMLLSFVAGYVDTVGFIALYGLFTAHVTGNLVLIGGALARASHHGLRAKLAALPVFVLVVALTTLYVQQRQRAGRPALHGALLMQVLLLTGFMLAALAAMPISDVDAPLAVTAGLVGVAAMSVQNAVSRLLLSELPPTTVMTGGVTQLAIDSASLIGSASADEKLAARKRLLRFLPPVLAFAGGAVAGALLYVQAGFVALAVPIIALLVVMILTRASQGVQS